MGLVTLDYTNKIMRIKCVNADIGYRVSCFPNQPNGYICLLYTSDAADD